MYFRDGALLFVNLRFSLFAFEFSASSAGLAFIRFDFRKNANNDEQSEFNGVYEQIYTINAYVHTDAWGKALSCTYTSWRGRQRASMKAPQSMEKVASEKQKL